ncbi:class GN sortase [Pseudothauera rhizosphaerae]|uniref:Class GN sortase n=1 Tax=Pseudothauera rhizosphaerae TaxID=2565932 RepID=A0A4V3WA72_9RHOO|nr:class GN sortase [Pseudothauera rhizosphaerae]THF58090.1 class GN sortase [Pseudothauera rhizosphaerae]
MKSARTCHHCNSKDFLGVECAWPAPACLGLSDTITPRQRWRARVLRTAAVLALAAGLWQFGQAGYIHAKAWLAQVLIGQAWAETQAGATQVKPWPWADTWPVARLRAPAHGVDLYVLAGAEGRTLAFGPGHMYGTALPGEDGNAVLGAHRDTHFAFLQWLEDGSELEVETPYGDLLRYFVAHREVVDQNDLRPLAQPPAGRVLTLVTCWPFEALQAGGPLRYVVTAVGAEENESSRRRGAVAL